ncbi:MAG: hypothetical protein RL750_220 [Bacteroidota bacterium]|jgi:hypothetical protein
MTLPAIEINYKAPFLGAYFLSTTPQKMGKK